MKKYLKKSVRWKAGLLIIVLLISTIVSSIWPTTSYAGSVRSDHSNLLDGRPFDICGKVNRSVMYHWTNANSVTPERSAFCIEADKMMWDTVIPDIPYGASDSPPLIQSAEQFQELSLILQWANNIDGAGKTPNDKYIVAQGAIWVVMQNERIGSAYFMNEMAKLKSHVKKAEYKTTFDSNVSKLIAYAQSGSGGSSGSGGTVTLPTGISASEVGAQQTPLEAKLENGLYKVEIDITSCREIKDITQWTFPDSGWSTGFENNILKFQHNGTTEPTGIISAKADALPATLRANLPKEGKIIFLDPKQGTDPNSSILQVMVSGLTPTGGGLYIAVNTIPNPHEDIPTWQIYRHTETFNSHYNIDLKKYCAETGKLLEGSKFNVLEGFNSDQLGGSLDEGCMYPEPTSWDGMRVCGSMTTDGDGHADHSDTRYYDYSKTYCTGHPEPELVECDHEGEEDCGCDEENQRRMKLWEAECTACEGSADFHDIDGNGLQMMISDRDQTYQDFTSLEYDYSVEEVMARNGYILHGEHNDDDPIETITTASSEAGGAGYTARSRAAAGMVPGLVSAVSAPRSIGQLRGLAPEWNPASVNLSVPVPVSLTSIDEKRTVTGSLPVPQIEEETKKESIHPATSSTSDRAATSNTAAIATGSNSQDKEKEDKEPDNKIQEKATDSNAAKAVQKLKKATPANSTAIQKSTDSEAEEAEEIETEEDSEEEDFSDFEEVTEGERELINDLALHEPYSYTLHPFGDQTVEKTDIASLTKEFKTPVSLLRLNETILMSKDDDEDITVTAPEPIEDNEPPVTPGEPGNLLYSWEVYNHRTEGELHINKRDLEWYTKDPDGSYGKSQGDATLEGAVYGLYAADNIIHPDGRTGTVFKRNDLVAITTTDHNGDASFLVITEESTSSSAADNLAHTWIGHPLILGNYYVKEIARSEGYELSVSGIKELDTNRTGSEAIISENGTAAASQLSHRIDNWNGSWNDFTITSRGTTDGYDITIAGYPEHSIFYRVDMKTNTFSEQVVVGSHLEDKKDSMGNPIYKKAEGGEFKIGPDGNYMVQMVASGSEALPDLSKPYTETFMYKYRLNYYPTGTAKPTVNPGKWADTTTVDEAYLKAEVNAMLRQLKYKPLDSTDFKGAPWLNLSLGGTTNVQIATEILDWYAAHDFWDCAQIESIYTDGGQRFARIFFDYTGLEAAAVYDSRHGDLYVKKPVPVNGGGENHHYWVKYARTDYKLTAYTAAVSEKKEIPKGKEVNYTSDLDSLIEIAYQPLYETYAQGDLILDREGNPIPETEMVYDYETQTYEAEIEDPQLLSAVYDPDQKTYTVHVPNTVDWDHTTGAIETIFRAAAPEAKITMDDGEVMWYAEYLTEKGEAGVSVSTTKKAIDSGTYIKTQALIYPGQNRVFQDAGTRVRPIIVLQRIIKQAIKVTKDIAQESYDDVNTYKIHNDPFTVLFGGYNGSKGTKTLKNFFFRLYLKQDLVDTGQLEPATASNATTEYNYEKLFADHPEYSKGLAVKWDEMARNKDGDLTTIHADQGTGVDDYYGTSIPLPYGTYVLVEQQPTTIPTKHYKIDRPQEIVLPFVPQSDPDGTIHENKESIEYFYDSVLTPEQLTARYHIRFNEESSVIRAHNNDGDFKVFKYGLKPELRQECGNAAVAKYYKCSSTSEESGTKDSVYYEAYVDRDGHVVEYGVTKYHVAAMTGITTAVDRKYAQALVPWSVLKPVIGGIVNADGDIGNRLPAAPGGVFNFVSYVNADMENMFYSSKIRIEKLDSETGENIIHDGALFKIYAAKREIGGTGTSGVTGTGKVVFDADGIPVYDENEQIKMLDLDGTEVGIFKAYSTIREIATGSEAGVVDKLPVGYIETYQPLGAGTYVLVEIQAPAGYAKSRPVAFEVYSDKVTYYEEGDQNRLVTAVKYQYAIPVMGDQNKYETFDVNQIKVQDYPSQARIHKVESGDKRAGDQNGLDGLTDVNDPGDTISYILQGSKKYLEARGDVTQITWNSVLKTYTGVVTKDYDEWSEFLIEGTEEELRSQPGVKLLYHLDGSYTGKGLRFDIYVNQAHLSLFQGLEVKKARAGGYQGVKVYYDKGRVSRITASETGSHLEITTNEKDKGPAHHDIWDTEEIKNPPTDVLFYDLKVTPIETDDKTGELYILDERGNRLCMADPVTGMAYVYDEYHRLIVYPVDNQGKKQLVRSIVIQNDGSKDYIYLDKVSVDDENGLPIYYKDGYITTREESWETAKDQPHGIARLPFGAYIIEEARVPREQGYIQAEHMGIILQDTKEEQNFYFQNDFTKIAVAKIDISSKQEIRDAGLTLYQAEKVENQDGYHLEYVRDQEGKKIIQTEWISGYEYDDNGSLKKGADGEKISTFRPHWIDHIPVGYYILEETSVPYQDGYVRSKPLEIYVKETGEVQSFVMEDDFTQMELLKLDTDTGRRVKGVGLALYQAVLDSTGKPLLDGDKNPKTGKLIGEWITGESNTGDNIRLLETRKAVYFITEEGDIHIDYLPIGYYVLAETAVPPGYASARPLLIHLEEISGTTQVQTFVMKDAPLKAVINKNDGTGKGIKGAALEVYRWNENGTRGDLVDQWVSNGTPHVIAYLPLGVYVLVEKTAPHGFLISNEIIFTVKDTSSLQWVSMIDLIPQGIIQVKKTDEGSGGSLAGAELIIKNLTTNQVIETIRTGSDGTAVSSKLPIGGTNLNGMWQIYRYEISESRAPSGYLLESRPHQFQFDYVDNKTGIIVYNWSLSNKKNTEKPPYIPPDGGGGDNPGIVPTGTPSQPTRVEERWEIPIIGKITALYPSKVAGIFQRLINGKRPLLPKLGDEAQRAVAAICLAGGAVLAGLVVLKLKGNNRKRCGYSCKIRKVNQRKHTGRRMFTAIVLLALAMILGICITAKAEETNGANESGGPNKSSLIISSDIPIASDSDSYNPAPSHVDAQGRRYQLKSWRMEPVTMEAYSQQEESCILYEQVEGKEKIPEELMITVEDERTYDRIKESIPLLSAIPVNEKWVDGFQFPVVFHRYDAQFYQMGAYLIPYNDEKPELSGYEAALLELIGASQEDYQVLDVFWDGEVYVDETGTLCRNAIAAGRKRVRDYQVIYGGEVLFPSYERYQCVAEYVPEEEEIPSLQEYTEAAKEESSGLSVWQILKFIWAVTIALAALIWLICVILLGLERRKRKKQEEAYR